MVYSLLFSARAISMACLMSRFCELLSPASQQKQIDHFTAPGVVDPIARPEVDAHFGDALANRFAIAKVAMLGGSDAVDDSGTSNVVLQGRKPSIEFFRPQKGIHTSMYPIGYRIATDYLKKTGSSPVMQHLPPWCGA